MMCPRQPDRADRARRHRAAKRYNCEDARRNIHMSKRRSREPRYEGTGGPPHLSRRAFLTGSGAIGVMAALAARNVAAQAGPAETGKAPGPAGAAAVAFRVNDQEHRLSIDPRTTL